MGGWLLAVAAGCFWAGILVAGVPASGMGTGAAVVIIACGVIGLTGAVVRRYEGGGWRSAFALFVVLGSFFLLGAGWSGLRGARVRDSPLARFVGHTVTVEGSLADDPKPGPLGWTATMQVKLLVPPSSVSSGEMRGGEDLVVHDPLWIEGHGFPPALGAGTRLAILGTLEMAHGPFADYLRHRGYPATFAVDRVTWSAGPSSPVLRAANALRSALSTSVRRVFPDRQGGLLLGLALGDTSRLDPGVEDSFRATGLSHLTAVSGENVAMFLAPILGLAGLLRIGRRSRFAIGVGAVGFFVLLTRAEPSVLRAAAMTGLTMFGVFLGRPRSPPAIFGSALLVLLGVNPTLVYAIGFQLSVAATAGMASLAEPLSLGLRFLPKPLALAAGATMGAQAGVTPLLLYHFGAVPTVSIPANLLAFPAVSPAMLLGLAAAAIGVVWTNGGLAVAALARIPLAYLEGLAARLARSPLPTITSGGGMFVLVVGLVFVALAAGWIRAGRPLSRRAIRVGLVAMPLVLWATAIRAGPPSVLTVTFFDVGQGDSALVRSPGGATVLIDGGPDAEAVATKLAALGIRRIDLMVATHPHADHVAGLPAVLVRFQVAMVVDPGCAGSSPYYAAFLHAVRASGIPFRHPHPPEVLAVGDLRMDVLGPDHCWVGTDSDPNNDSLVLRVRDGPDSVLFAGDAEKDSQTDILRAEGPQIQAEVLKVPHHGGDTSLGEFLRDTHAAVAIVSVGPNRYGHPVPALLHRLVRDGMRVYRTDRSGDVTVRFGEGGELLIQSSHG